MREDNNTYERIEAYLNKELNDLEMASFEESLNVDPKLQQKVDSHRFANLLVKKNGLIEIKTIIQKEDIKDRRLNIYKKICIALIFASLGILGIWVYQNNEKDGLKTKPVNTTSDQKPEIWNEEKIFPEITSVPAVQDVKNEKTQPLSGNKPVAIAKDLKTDTVIGHKENTGRIPDPETTVLIPKSPDVAIHQPQETKTDLCLQTNISAHVTVNQACEGETNGSIHVSGFKGGKAPYNVEFHQNDHTNTVAPLHLAAGNYSAIVKDANGCQKNFDNIVVKETDCTKEFYLNISNGDLWEIPSNTVAGTLFIYDRVGNVYFSAEIAAGIKEKWNGYSSKGELNSGFYPFTIKYRDGSSKEGSITLGK